MDDVVWDEGGPGRRKEKRRLVRKVMSMMDVLVTYMESSLAISS